MEQKNHTLLFVLLFVVVAVAFVSWIEKDDAQVGHYHGTDTYRRVMESGVIRCGWAPAAPLIYADGNTGEISGPMADIAREMAKALELKIEWKQSDWGRIAQDLDSNKFDVMCAGMWGAPMRAKGMMFSRPLAYSPIVPIIRVDDKRFEGGMEAFNQATVTIAIKEGTISDFIARRYFPKANRLVVKAKATDVSDEMPFIEVAQGRADVALFSADIMDPFKKANPNTLRAVTEHGPIEMFPNVFGVKLGEHSLLVMVNEVLDQLVLNGRVATAMEKSGLLEKSFRLPVVPYQRSK